MVKPENKENAIESPSDDLQGAETAQFGYGGFGGGIPNGYGAYFGNGGYGGGYGGYGGDSPHNLFIYLLS